MSKIFISYSRDDQPWVSSFAQALENSGYQVWWDPNILPGQDYHDIIQRSLDEADVIIVVWSSNSINSKWVRAEANQAFEKGRLVPIVISKDCRIPLPFNSLQTASFIDWDKSVHNENYKLLTYTINVIAPQGGSHQINKKTPSVVGNQRNSEANEGDGCGLFVFIILVIFVVIFFTKN